MRINRPGNWACKAVAVAALMLVFPSPALAHEASSLAGAFGMGFLHPLSGPDHMLAMIAVGVWGAFLGRPLVIALPMIFPTVMAIGAGVGMMGFPLPPVEVGIALSVLVLGLMILFAVRAPVPVACAIVAIFGLFHGYAHGVELPSAANPVGYSTGFVLSTGLLHLSGIALGLLTISRIGTLALRGAGGAIALCGALISIGALTR